MTELGGFLSQTAETAQMLSKSSLLCAAPSSWRPSSSPICSIPPPRLCRPAIFSVDRFSSAKPFIIAFSGYMNLFELTLKGLSLRASRLLFPSNLTTTDTWCMRFQPRNGIALLSAYLPPPTLHQGGGSSCRVSPSLTRYLQN